ncbi:hypothetical protein ISN44_Un135g000030 [Arabidopsis suecica]|uniref:Uncharacterized protein n=1 Tax=Arabidopsis suecica TaxID=45249 RepID=A0A8T1XCL6_ARASU|nr:hypothetical protein ISN44_Un135g000030 [Arabidopsis suecica]
MVCFQVQNKFTRSLLDPLPYCPRGEPEEQLLDQLFIASEGKQQNSYSTREPEEAAIYSTSLLDPGSHRGGSRFYSIKAALEEATDRSTCPSYSILYLTPLLDQGRPTLQDLLIIQSVFGSSSFPTQSDS